ncbi:MAG TPA: ABC transporter substrate-binding protein [Rhodopila sp.]|nr:ABC transporter substrate-binding protein [Rhodopila sp.]
MSVGTAAEVTDATGRRVVIPDRPERVLPAGPPAAALLAAIAPGQMVGFPEPTSSATRDALAPQAATLPQVPRLTGTTGTTTAIQALHPDLIIDYGAVSPRYQQLARETQAQTGIPTLLFDGSLDQIPAVARMIGTILHQPERAETVALSAEAILALPPPSGAHPRVLYARGPDGTLVASPNTDVTEVFSRLRWQVVAPEGKGMFRRTTIDAIRALDPDIIVVGDPAAKHVLTSPAWAGLTAVREGHVYVAPAIPFGWIEEPPSINRLAGLAWLHGANPLTLAALFNANIYGRVLTRNQLVSVASSTSVVKP